MHAITVLGVIAFSLHRKLDLYVAEVGPESIDPNTISTAVFYPWGNLKVDDLWVGELADFDGASFKGVFSVGVRFVVSDKGIEDFPF